LLKDIISEDRIEVPKSENKNEHDRGSTRRVMSHLHSNPSVLMDSSSYMIIIDDDDDDAPLDEVSDDVDDVLVEEEMIMDIA